MDFLTLYLGDATTFVLCYYLVTKVRRKCNILPSSRLTFCARFQLVSYYNGYIFWNISKDPSYEKYRIQNDRRIPIELEQMAWENRHGWTGIKALFITGLPMLYLGYFIMHIFGIDVHKMPKSYKAAVYEFAVGTFVWDTSLFWIHYGLHKFPYLYKMIHKVRDVTRRYGRLRSGQLILQPQPSIRPETPRVQNGVDHHWR